MEVKSFFGAGGIKLAGFLVLSDAFFFVPVNGSGLEDYIGRSKLIATYRARANRCPIIAIISIIHTPNLSTHVPRFRLRAHRSVNLCCVRSIGRAWFRAFDGRVFSGGGGAEREG